MSDRSMRDIADEKAAELPAHTPGPAPAFEEVKDEDGNVVRLRFNSLADVKAHAYRQDVTRTKKANLDFTVIEATAEEKTRLEARRAMEERRLAARLQARVSASLARKSKPPTERE